MLPYSAAVYTNQLQQAAALSYHHHQQQQQQQQQGPNPPSPATSLQLSAALNFERLRYGFAAVQPPNGIVVPAAGHVAGGGGVVGPNQAQGGSPVAGGYPPPVFQHTAAAAFDPITLAAAGFRHAFDPRTGRFLPPEEPKPQHSYIGLIAMAILSNSEKKMVLSDIYQWILDHYPYFRTRGPGWRNSIRHNLSLNDCFIKAGRSANGKGHYWAIHPANVEDFKKGDFRRRRAQRKVRKHMGLSVPDDEDDSDDSPCSSPPVSGGNFFLTANGTLAPPTAGAVLASLPAVHAAVPQNLAASKVPPAFLIDGRGADRDRQISEEEPKPDKQQQPDQAPPAKRKRLFDMESLLSSRTDEKRAANVASTESSTGGQRQNGEDNASDNGSGSDKPSNLLIGDHRPQPLGVPNPFFFPPPVPPSGPGTENGHFLAAMAAAAAGFMPFAFLPGAGAPTVSLPWNFGCVPPTSSAAAALSSFLPMPQVPSTGAPSLGGGYFWQNGSSNGTVAASLSPPRPGSKTASNTPSATANSENGTNGDTPMQHAAPSSQDGNGCGRAAVVEVTRSPSPQDTAAQWQETFAKIMARSYQGRNLIKSNSLCISKGPCQSSDVEEDESEEKLSKSPKALPANG